MTAEFDYIVVGSGAGGGPLAANLARAGMRVLVLEAGGDAENYHYRVPCFHGLATEDEEYAWDFFVRHYADDARQQQDSKYDPDRDGVYYPRAGTLGGCTSHNAMITVYPHNQDWDDIAAATGDQSWRSDRMRAYFERLERNDYARRPWAYPRNKALAGFIRRFPLLDRFFGNKSRHGFDGWLATQRADPLLVYGDWALIDILLSAARAALSNDLGRPLDFIENLTLGAPLDYADPNDWRVHKSTSKGEGLWLTPLATNKGKRNGTREYLLATQQRLPDQLHIRTNCFVTKVLFEGNKAVGVEYVEAPHAYGADPRQDGGAAASPRKTVRTRREVILSGGAFNTPQLLKLSGVGPKEELAKHGIDVVVDLPGVGEGLQDRYEVGVVWDMPKDFRLLEDATFKAPLGDEPGDSHFQQWTKGEGVYCTNGALLGVTKRSTENRPLPDLFVFGLPARFKGYFKGYSSELAQHHDVFTWAILKAHTRNTAGYVRLRSDNPFETPEINFRYFEEGDDAAGEDLQSVVEGVKFARRLMAHVDDAKEIIPGPDVTTDDDIAEFVRNEAWGHHASCTCRMGPSSDSKAVVDTNFKVHGTTGLRVVDASVFPKIPGFFIVTAVYMLSEKATDAVLADVPRPTRMAGKAKTVQSFAATIKRSSKENP